MPGPAKDEGEIVNLEGSHVLPLRIAGAITAIDFDPVVFEEG